MPDHAGYAVALTIRERVLNDSLLLSYHAGNTNHRLVAPVPDGPPPATVDFFLDLPRIQCTGDDPERFTVSLRGWGRLGIVWANVAHAREVRWDMRIAVRARYVVAGREIVLAPEANDVTLEQWTFALLAGSAFPPDVDDYLRGGIFKNRMEAAFRRAVELGAIELPAIPADFLGSIVEVASMEAGARVVRGAVVIGLDVDSFPVTTSGDRDLLVDFARGNDLAAVTNPGVVPVMMRDAEQTVRDEVARHGATLERLDVTAQDDRLRVEGAASNSAGRVTFSMNVIPLLFDGRPGAFLPFPKHTQVVKARTWPAIAFRAVDVKVDVDRATWVVVVEAVGALLTGAVIPLIVEDLVRQVTQQVTFAARNAQLPAPVPRIRRLQALVPGDPAVRLEITEFEVRSTGMFTGILLRPEVKAPALLGLTSIPQDLTGENLQYRVQLPLDLLPDDPRLRIRWRVVDLASGATLVNDDAPAEGRLTLDFAPAAIGPATTRFGVTCRVYRTLGPEVTEFLNEGIQLDVHAPVPAGTYVRWRYDVKNPQVRFDQRSNSWGYGNPSERVVRRWSAIHRLDKPCRMAHKRSRYTYEDQFLDRLPFPLEQILDRRDTICEYCFFGGPGNLLPSL